MNQAKEIVLVETGKVRPNPKNRNKHNEEQIARLVDIIRYQGFRIPLVVSKRSGLLVAGHGRLLAAKELGMSHVPVIYQDFESEDQEYAAGISDNAIGAWAELDLPAIHLDLPDINLPSIELLGIKGFEFEPYKEKDGSQELNPDEFQNFKHTCPKCGFEFDKFSDNLK